ncbi:MAG: hypothetical protein R2788_09000 [Saprospiraceae bacterium]
MGRTARPAVMWLANTAELLVMPGQNGNDALGITIEGASSFLLHRLLFRPSPRNAGVYPCLPRSLPALR